MAPSTRTSPPLIASIALAILGLLPFHWVLGLTPMSRDAAIWLDKSRWMHPKWFEWTFETQHFRVGYRPATSLSYTVNHALSDNVLGYRLTDFGLHAAAVVLVYALTRRLAPTRSPWGATFAAAVMALHPLVANVVPHLARRGYTLATVFSLTGLLLLQRARPATDALAMVALAAGALSNEAGYVALPVAALMLWERGRAALPTLGGLGGTLAMLLATRWWMIGGIGGYASGERSGRALTAGIATWTTLLPVGAPDAAEGDVLPGAPIIGAVALLALPLLLLPLRRFTEREDRSSWLMIAWMIGLTLVYLPNGVWFPRQVYMLLAPFAVLMGLSVTQGTGWREPSRLVAGLVAAFVLLRSTVLTGPDADHRASWEQTDATTRRLIAALEETPRKQDLWLVVPFSRRPGAAALRAREANARRRGDDPLGARISQQWAQIATHRKGLETVAIVYTTPADRPPYVTVSPAGSAWSMAVQGEHELSLSKDLVENDHTVRLAPPEGTWLYIDDGIQGQLVHR